MPTLSSNFHRHNGREVFAKALEELGGFSAEYKFHNKRAWRFDYFCYESQIAVEIEGAVFAGGRHSRGGGFTKDTDKYNTATCIGIAVYRVTTTDLRDPDRLNEHVSAISRLHAVRKGFNQSWFMDHDVVLRNVFSKRGPKNRPKKLKVPK